MKQRFIQKNDGNAKLALIFSGYGQDDKVYSKLKTQNSTDLAVVFDYGSMDFDARAFAAYQSIRVLSWSMGVMVAPLILEQAGLLDKVSDAIAVNGTKEGIDDRLGIPSRDWLAFIANLSEASVLRFYRRMCGTPPLFREYLKVKPNRSLLSLKTELENLLLLSEDPKLKACCERFHYDKAYAGERDLIFSFENQIASWSAQNTDFCTVKDAAHYCPKLFAEILSGL